MEKETNLCDSCNHEFATCPAQGDDITLGTGDNVVRCKKYQEE